MPIDPEGEKWACEPCIRGHRSTKCEHFDRFMMKVKRPGRPLSKCPHPKGKCSCAQEKVLMARISKGGVCLCEPVPLVQKNLVTIDGQIYAMHASAASPNHRIQKPLQRQGSVTMPKNIIQDIANDIGPGGDGHSPWLNATYEGPHSLNGSESYESALGNSPEEQKPRLRLGMMGVGGYGAGKDDIGWHGSWPDLKEEEAQEQQDIKNVPRSCCSKRPEQPQVQSSSKSCCSDQLRQPLVPHGLPMSTFPTSETGASMPLHGPGDSFPGSGQRKSWSGEMMGTSNNDPLVADLPADNSIFHNSHNGVNRSHDAATATAVPDQPLQTFQENGSSQSVLGRQQHNNEHSPHKSHQRNDSGPSMHRCNCGDLCKCFGCPTHPNNTTTQTRMQELGQIMSYEQHENESDRSGSRPHTAYGGIISWAPNSTTNSRASYSSDTSAFSTNVPTGASNGFDPLDASGQHFLFQSLPMDLNYDRALMSPSTYVNVEYEYPLGWNDCSNVVGSCRCGADCVCEGCLTHSGHNGIPLEMNAGNIGNEIDVSVSALPHSSAIGNGFATSQYSEALGGGITGSFQNEGSVNLDYGQNFAFGEHPYTNGRA